MAADWFRRSTWSEGDEREFMAKLSRAQHRSRAQYLRIQAYHLATAQPPVLDAALRLLMQLVEQYPDDNLQLRWGYCQIGECQEALGNYAAALDSYQCAIQQTRIGHSKESNPAISFALLVAALKREGEYQVALDLLEEFEANSPFPVERFHWHGARALILSAQGHADEARDEAERALIEVDRDKSEARNHPRLGLVGEDQDGLRRQLLAIAGNSSEPLVRPGKLFH